jgi:hypothetical protein
VKDHNEYTISVPVANPEETKVNNEIQDYILERLKEVRIDDSKRRKSYSEIVKNGYNVKEKIDEDMTLSSDDDTCRVSHKTNEDESSKEEDTKFSKSTMQSKATAQSKAIADLQETVKLLQET